MANAHAVGTVRRPNHSGVAEDPVLRAFSDQVDREIISSSTLPSSGVHVSLVGLPAAAKSAVVLSCLRNEDAVVVPTVELCKKWRADLKAAKLRTRVFTQHKLLVDPSLQHSRFRILVIDEAFLLESAHVHALSRFSGVTVCVGDVRQIVGFHLRGQSGHFSFLPEFARFVISAPFSLGLPLPVLLLGKRLGFVDPQAVTLNRTGWLRFSQGTPSPTTPDRKHLSIVFNRSQLTHQRLTAHESQGSRCRTADVVVTHQESNWVPFSGHFWVAVSRATLGTTLFLCPLAASHFRSAIQGVNGYGLVSFQLPSSFSVLRPKLDSSFVSARGLHNLPSLMESTSRRTLVGDAPTREENSEFLHFENRTVAAVTFSEISDAILAINLNVNQISYADVVDLQDVYVPRELNGKLTHRLDLRSDVRGSSSILPSAGVFFSSRDTKTEMYTIAERYLANAPFKEENPAALAHLLLQAFDRAYVDPSKEPIFVDGSYCYLEWFLTRKESTFDPSPYHFGEEKPTVQFQSFLKAHAKAKNDIGFGSQMEKGQTIAAGDESYNARFTSIARQLQTALLSVLSGDVILDIGYSDVAFAEKCRSIGLGTQSNTQVDLSSQDSTHRQCHVLALITLIKRYTDASVEECDLYFRMRESFVVRARNFNTDQAIVYSQNWSLPSGDPFTLIANCIHEMTSTAYVFALTPEIRGPCAAKGDDQLYNGRLHFGPAEKVRADELGVKFKIDYDLPPFFAGRLILPTGTVCYDPVKIAAKYSVKNVAPENVDELVLAYAQILPPLSPEDFELLQLSLGPHHPSMSPPQIRVASLFAFSLWNKDFFLRFQKRAVRVCYQFVDAPSFCVNTVLRVLGHPLVPNFASSLDLRAILGDNHIPFVYVPGASRFAMRCYAQRNRDVIIFSDTHALAYANTSNSGF
jgi:hypothetical protein